MSNKVVFYNKTNFRIVDGKIYFGNRIALGSYDISGEDLKSKSKEYVNIPTHFVVRANRSGFYEIVTAFRILHNGEIRLGSVELKPFDDKTIGILPRATFEKWRDVEYIINNLSSHKGCEWVIYEEDWKDKCLTS